MAGADVECESVTRAYRRGSRALQRRWLGRRDERPRVVALSDVDLSVAPDEFVGIAGPSGSGKSTLLHLLAALDESTSGRVVVGGTDVATLSGRERTRFRRDRVGVVFQHFHLLSSLSARANVALPLVERGVPKSTRRERAADLLDAVGLSDRAGHRPTELSGGEQQRVAIARALATDPPLVVADEPTGELDSATAERVLDVLASVGERRTVVLASHDRQALSRADRVVHLRDGEVTDRDGGVEPAVGTAADPSDAAAPADGTAAGRDDRGPRRTDRRAGRSAAERPRGTDDHRDG